MSAKGEGRKAKGEQPGGMGSPPSPFALHPSPVWTVGVRREVLANGLTLLVQPDHSAPVVAVVTHVRAGFFDERWQFRK